MKLPPWMMIGDKSPCESLGVWGLLGLSGVGVALAIFGSFVGQPQGFDVRFWF